MAASSGQQQRSEHAAEHVIYTQPSSVRLSNRYIAADGGRRMRGGVSAIWTTVATAFASTANHATASSRAKTALAPGVTRAGETLASAVLPAAHVFSVYFLRSAATFARS